jgi:hypothetical protein
MDVIDFERRARKPTLSRDELETLKLNALAKDNREFAAIVDEILRERFSAVSRKSGGATPTTAVFLNREQDFPSGKDAYLWLVQRFREHKSGLFESQELWHRRAFKGATRTYFATSPQELFPKGSEQSSISSNFSEIPGGWYANVNLSHGQKFDILLGLSAVCNLEYLKHWDFRVVGASLALAEKKKHVARGQELLEELTKL